MSQRVKKQETRAGDTTGHMTGDVAGGRGVVRGNAGLSEAASEPVLSIADSDTSFSAVELVIALSAAGLGAVLSTALGTGSGDKTGTSKIWARRDRYLDRALAAITIGIS